MKKYYVIYSGFDGYQTVDKNGKIVCGKHYGSVIPEWNDGQQMAAYYQFETQGISLSEALQKHKDLVFRQAYFRNKSQRRRRA